MTEDINKVIDEKVKNNHVLVFIKGTPDAPQCGFSNQVVSILKMLKADFASVDVIGQPEFRESVKEFSNWPTIPQIFVDGKFLGGCDIFTELYEKGELEELVKKSKPEELVEKA